MPTSAQRRDAPSETTQRRAGAHQTANSVVQEMPSADGRNSDGLWMSVRLARAWIQACPIFASDLVEFDPSGIAFRYRHQRRPAFPREE